MGAGVLRALHTSVWEGRWGKGHILTMHHQEALPHHIFFPKVRFGGSGVRPSWSSHLCALPPGNRERELSRHLTPWSFPYPPAPKGWEGEVLEGLFPLPPELRPSGPGICF